MKKFYFLLVFAFFYAGLKAQPVMIYAENFDGSLSSLTRSPLNRWVLDSSFKSSSPHAMKGIIPSHVGDSVELITDWIDARLYSHLLFTFKHICKVSENDLVTIEYHIDKLGQTWKPIPTSSYGGSLAHYKGQRFSQKSYSEWKADDSLAQPASSWWKTETFDLSAEAGWERVRFKFKIKRGNILGTQFAYGWLIDDIQLYGANSQIRLPLVQFLSPLISDTVYSTGPYVVNAKVATRTTAPIIHPILRVSYTYNNISTYDSIVMTDQDGGDSLWTATIPQKLFGTYITYSINGKDTSGNELTISSNYYIKRAIGGASGEVIIGTATTNQPYAPFYRWYDYSWSKTIYLSSEISSGQSAFIDEIAWNVSSTGVVGQFQSCYFKAVDDNAFANANWVDPTTDGATLVWSGTFSPTISGWISISLDNRFLLPAGKNLLIYWLNYANNYTSPYTYWTSTSTSPNYMTVYNYQDRSFPTSAGTQTYLRPDLKLHLISGSCDSNSVSMLRIDQPSAAVLGGQSTDVKVSIKNCGFKNLSSCIINWSINGILQSPYHWTGNLPDDFSDTSILLGSYYPGMTLYDTLVVWVSMPNGVIDTTTYDDTLNIITFGCGGYLSGDYIIGNKTGANFSSIEEAINILKTCGAINDVTFKIQSGTYEPFIIPDLSMYMGTYTLTFTSLDNNADSVIIDRQSGTYALKLEAAKNVSIKNITFLDTSMVTGMTYGIEIANSATNIEIRGCNIIFDTLSTNYDLYAPIYKSNNGIINGLRIINNQIEGGYYGIYLCGSNSSSTYGSNIIIDSNIIKNQYENTVYFRNADLKSFSYNTILTRIQNVSSYWYGVQFDYCNFVMNANKFHQRSTSISNPRFVYSYYAGVYNSSGRSLMSNNEIIGFSSDYSEAMNLYYCALDIYHNSILMQGNGSITNIYIGGSSTYVTDCKNNNFVNLSSDGYLLYVDNAGIYTGDYNNLYSFNSIGYYNGLQSSLNDWQTVSGQDIHSVTVSPIYLGDSSKSLKLFDYTGLACPALLNVTEDIEGVLRAGQTGMGAYTIYPTQLNAATLGAANWNPSVVIGQNVPVNGIIANMGTDSLVSVYVNWSFNGVAQPSISWTGLLRTYDKDTVLLGNIYPISGTNTIKIWTSSPNNGTDDNVYNDTSTFILYGCDSLYHGIYTVGTPSSDFVNLASALSSINNCGLDGPTTLLFATGVYDGLVFNKTINGMSAINTLTIASQTANPDDVRFTVNSGSALTLNDVTHFCFKDITFDGSPSSQGIGVNMKGACVNIEFRNCKILASPTSTNTSYAFYKESGGICDSIRLINNVISGGYYGLYFYGGSSSPGGYNTNIYIDSNIIEKAYYYSYYFYYTDLNSFSYNKIYPRVGNTDHYMRFYYTNHYNTVCNTMDYSKTNVKYAYNYFYYPHYANYNGLGLIANNEIILSPYAQEGYGMYLSNTNGTVRVYHNSIFDPGTSNYSRGLYLNCSSGTGTFEIISNNVWSNGYPIYVTGSSVSVTSDYNNFYGTGSRIGYFNTDCSSLSDWQTASGDLTSVNVAPQYLDSTESLEMISSTGLTCPQLSAITNDKLGNLRNTTTTIGCYEFLPKSYDVAAKSITSPSGTLIAGTATQSSVLVRNYGTVTITSMDIYWSVNGVAQPKYVWSGSLPSQSTANITLGNFNAITGSNIIKIWTALPNGQPDERPSNDTIMAMFTGCDSLLSGTYTLGNGGTFANMSALTTAISSCGIGGPVVIQMLPGKYSEMIFNGTIPGTDSINTITFTSYNNNVDSVIIESTTGNEASVHLSGGASYLIFDHLTVNGCMNNGVSVSAGFGLFGCSYIKIQNCKINVLPEDNWNYSYAGIYTSWQNSQFDHIWIDNNEIKGSQFGIYLESNTLSGPVFIRDNKINTRYCGLCSYDYIILSNLSYNTIEYDTNSTTGEYNPFRCYGWMTQGSLPDTMWIVGNKIRFNAVGSINYGGFSLYDFHPSDALVMANNEFYYPNNPDISNIYCTIGYNDNLHFINNSMLSNISSGYLELYGNGGKTILKNNNLVNLDGGDLLMINGQSITESDYNNIYSSAVTLSTWQSMTGQDVHSVSVSPYFLNPALNLDLLDDSGLECPRDSLVMKDITLTQRDSITSIGAYQIVAVSNNILPRSLASPLPVSITGSSTPVSVTVYNAGLNAVTSFNIDWFVNGVRQSTIPWIGNLNPKNSITINLGVFIPLLDSNMIIVYTSLPNGIADVLPMNDTLHFYSKGCDSLLHGNYIVYDDNTLANVIDKLQNCGLSDAVTIQLANGVYRPIALTRNFLGSDTNKTVTFTSLSGNPDSVIFYADYNNPALQIKTNHVKFEKLSFDGSSVDNYVVYFTGGCSDVEFYGCNLLSDTINANYNSRIIFKNYNTGIVNDIRFIKNFINGGYYGVYFIAGTGTNALGKIVIDSNVIKNAYYYSLYFEYTELTSLSHNTILSRVNNASSEWYAINSWNTKYKFMNANKIHQRSAGIYYAYGIYGYYSNSSDFTNDTGFISNNEIVLNAGSNCYGMYFPYSKLEIYHNSIYLQGSGNASGIYLYGNDPIILKNNILITPSGGYPIRIGSSSLPFYADYNNYYNGGSSVGEYNYNTITTIQLWQAATGQDAHSVSLSPIFTFSDTSFLELSSSAGFYCPVLKDVSKDINGKGRYGFTAMGAYTNQAVALDVAIIDVDGWNPSCVIGATFPVKAVLMNLSSAQTLTSTKIDWTINGISQTAYNWTGSLLQYEADTILLGNFYPVAGTNTLRLWSSNPNLSTDLEPTNDTLMVISYGCDSLLHGVYTVGGVGADFASIADVELALGKCGVDGPTEFRLAAGDYTALAISGNVLGSSTVNTITFTSATMNAANVRFIGKTALSLSSTNNIKFKYITFGDSTGYYGVQMMGKCDNIEFYRCVIQMDVTSYDYSYAFYKPQGGVCDGLRFVGNVVDGGYFAFYLYGQSDVMGGYNTNVIIDSNVFSNFCYSPFNIYYTDLTSFSYNVFTARSGGEMYMYSETYYTNHNYTVGNRINTSNNTSLDEYNNYIGYANMINSSGRGFFANNEIINTSNSGGYGVSINSSNLDVYHNSIYAAGSSWATAIYMDAWQGQINCKNNQLFAQNIPIRVYQENNVTVENNNYYSFSGIVGEWEGVTCNTLNDWISESGDTTAKNIAPSCVDITQSLDLVNYTGMACTRLPNVLNDINNRSRSSITTLGAYSLQIVEGFNLSVDEVTEPSLISVVKCYPDFSTVKASLYNAGTLPVDLSVSPVTLHLDVSGAMSYKMDTILTVGALASMSKDTITLTHMMPTSATGLYDIKVWLTFGLDNKSDDDTAYSSYLVERVTLPYDVYFDSIPQEMAFQQIQGDVGFEVVDASEMTLPPFYGTGSLTFKSSTGLASMARAFIKQVDLQGTSKPTLNFWYQHDNQNPDKPDQMDVIVSTDGGATFTYLYTVERYDPTLSGPSWKLHQVDLSFFIQSTCLIIGFEAQSYAGGDQFIDRVFVEVQQDLVPTEIRLPSDLYACDLTNKPIEVIVANTTVYAVEMDKDTINLTVEITTPDSNKQVSTYRFLGKIPPMSSDTILVHSGFDFSQAGTYNIKAYIDTIKITTDVSNDTITRIIEVHPDVSLQSLENMGDKRIGDTVYAKVSIKNTGDLLIPETPLRLQINNSNDIVETLQTPLYPGDSIEYIFTQPYIVPEVNTVQPYYQISVATELSCDYMASNNKATLIAGVSVVELQILSIEKPDPLVCDTGFSYVYPSIQLSNNGHNNLENVRIYVKIDSASIEVSKISEVFASVPVGAQVYTFTTPYPVPNLTGNYEVTVFIDKVTGEMDDSNDTLSMEACAIEFGTAVPGYDASTYWTMDQNMPNPASAATQITYSIPQEGVIRFTITTITGQVLYSRDIPSAAGSHSLEFDTQHLAGGIYYYSMEYQGQRIVKKMTIQK